MHLWREMCEDLDASHLVRVPPRGTVVAVVTRACAAVVCFLACRPPEAPDDVWLELAQAGDQPRTERTLTAEWVVSAGCPHKSVVLMNATPLDGAAALSARFPCVAGTGALRVPAGGRRGYATTLVLLDEGAFDGLASGTQYVVLSNSNANLAFELSPGHNVFGVTWSFYGTLTGQDLGCESAGVTGIRLSLAGDGGVDQSWTMPCNNRTDSRWCREDCARRAVSPVVPFGWYDVRGQALQADGGLVVALSSGARVEVSLTSASLSSAQPTERLINSRGALRFDLPNR